MMKFFLLFALFVSPTVFGCVYLSGSYTCQSGREFAIGYGFEKNGRITYYFRKRYTYELWKYVTDGKTYVGESPYSGGHEVYKAVCDDQKLRVVLANDSTTTQVADYTVVHKDDKKHLHVHHSVALWEDQNLETLKVEEKLSLETCVPNL